jgi:diguanylate cyclase (GGDEF)-like protein
MSSTSPYAASAVRSWHARGAIGTVVLGLICYAASITTHEADSIGYWVANTLVAAAAWVLLRRRSRETLLVWPTLVIIGLYGAHVAAPRSAALCQGAIVVAFLFVGLTQQRWTSLLVWPIAGLVAWQSYRLPIEQSVVRLTLASAVWLCVAELPALLISQLRHAQADVDSLASTDPLTGLANRRGWDDRIAALLAAGSDVAVLLIDLDHFKAYNDTYGHLAGDDLLVTFAEALTAATGRDDVVARWGGEEFAVGLRAGEAPGQAAGAVAERLRRCVPRGQTCSIGLVVARPGECGADVMQRADAALYRAKHEGRDRVVAA